MNPTSRLIVGTVWLGCLVLSGCNQTVKHGVDVQTLQSFKIEKGKTTKQELIDHFGPPMSTVTKGDGTQELAWSGAQGKSSDTLALMFIPFAPVHMREDPIRAQATWSEQILNICDTWDSQNEKAPIR